MFSQEVEAVKEVRRIAEEHATDLAEQTDWHPNNIRRACRTFAGNTATGVDDIHLRTIAYLPDSALFQLAAVMRTAVAARCLPAQTLISLMSLLGKKSGGSRTIVTVSTFYRLLLRILKPTLSEWDDKAAGFWDTAVKGSSALKAHLARALELEVAAIEGKKSLLFLWDLRKFYDSIRLSKLVKELIKHGFPPTLLALGAIAHKAPRMLKAGLSYSGVIESPARSILAGCQLSCSWARGLLYDLLESLT